MRSARRSMRELGLGARRARLGVVHRLFRGELADDVLDRDDHVRLAGDGDAVREPAGLAAHGLDDEVAAGRHRVGAQVEELVRHDVDGREEAEREVDAAVVVVDGLGDVDDAHARRSLRAGAAGTRRGRFAVRSVSSPPIETSASMSRSTSASYTRRRPVGLRRVVEVPRRSRSPCPGWRARCRRRRRACCAAPGGRGRRRRG